MILVTGAAGQTGRALLGALARRGAAARALVSRSASVPVAQGAGAVDVQVGDLRSAADVRAAMSGCSKVYHICPVMSDAELEIGRHVMRAAEAEGGAHFVFHSLVHSQVDALLHHRDKRRVEEALIESTLPFTFMKPTMYMQNMLWEWDTITRQGVYRLPYSEHARMSLVDLDDVAEAGAVALTEPGWEGGEFELCSGDQLTRIEMAAVLSSVLQRDVRAESYDIEQWKPIGARTRTPFQVKRVAAMFAHYHAHGLSGGNARVLQMMLGRVPTDFRSFVQRSAAARPPLPGSEQ